MSGFIIVLVRTTRDDMVLWTVDRQRCQNDVEKHLLSTAHHKQWPCFCRNWAALYFLSLARLPEGIQERVLKEQLKSVKSWG